MRKLFFLFAVLLMASTQIFAASSIGDWFVSGNLRYKITSFSPNTVEVTTAGANTTQHYPLTAGTTSVTIPVTVQDNLGAEYTVTKIGGGSSPANGAFSNSTLQTINFAEGSQVTEIGEYAFYKSAITAITLPASVTTIGRRAFNSCADLAQVTVPWTSDAAIPTPGSDAFGNIATGAVLKAPIGTKALYEAKGWNPWFTIDAPTPANNQIFYQSSDHQVVTLNIAIYFDVTVTSNVYNTEADYGVITFSGELTTIGSWAFTNRTNLTTIVWPSTVTSIGKDAFSGCAGMAELTIPSTVTSIGGSAFAGWTNLTKLTVKAGSIGIYAFADCTKLSSIDLQEGVTSIGADAFNGCAGQAELILPSTVTSIGADAFNGWQNLTKLMVKAGDIGERAFQNCTKLSSLNLQEGVTSIGGDAFSGCAGSTELIIPSTVTSIGGSAFAGWTNLTKLTVKARSIGWGAFSGCTNLSSVDLQEGVTSIEESAFKNCAGMAELTIPSTVTSIGNGAFNGLQNLTKLTVKAGSIGIYAFADCTKLSSIDLQEGVTSIGESAFDGCASLTKLTIKAGSIGKNAFNRCTNLDVITLGNGLTSIGNSAFSGCNNVSSVTFLGSLILNDGSLNSIGTAESPANLSLPSYWPINDKPVNSTTPWHGGYFNCTYVDPASELLGEMGEPCEGCHTVKVTKGDKTITLYAPDNVEFIKAIAE